MSSILDKWIAIFDLFKAGNSRKDTFKSLKVKKMLVWRTLKRLEETGDIQNIAGQSRPRTARTPKLVKSIREKIRKNPKRSIQNLAKESRMLYGTMSTEDVSIQACQETKVICDTCKDFPKHLQLFIDIDGGQIE